MKSLRLLGISLTFLLTAASFAVNAYENGSELTDAKGDLSLSSGGSMTLDKESYVFKGKHKSVVVKTTEDTATHNLEYDGMIIFSKVGYAYKRRPIKPFVSVYVGGKSLKKNKDFTVTYENNVDIGTGTLTVTGKGEYEGTLSAEFPIIPKKVKMKKVTNYESGFQVTWKNNGPIDGFELQYATDPEFNNPVSKKIEDAESSSAEVSGLVVGTEYFVRIRAYKTVDDKIFNSNWSDVKSVLIYPY